MVAIPEGSFWRGSPAFEKNHQSAESPQQLVELEGFFLGQTPITQAQWRAVVEKIPPIEKELEAAPSDFKGDHRPVENVNWYDAIEFCARLSRLTGRAYGLPSEAQWEYACRAIQLRGQISLEDWNERYSQPFYFGATITGELANYDASQIYQKEKKGKGSQETIEVKSFSPNQFGLYDMHGNVTEWCADPWHGSYTNAPVDGSVWDEDPERYLDVEKSIKELLNTSRTRTRRGGSWSDTPGDCRSACRPNFNPGLANSRPRFSSLCVAGDSLVPLTLFPFFPECCRRQEFFLRFWRYAPHLSILLSQR